MKNKQFVVNNIYKTKKGQLVVFLGLQDGKLGKTHGFFRELSNSDTFFGMRLSELS